MKKVIGAALFAAALFVAGQVHAQTKDTTSFKTKVHKTTKQVGDAATKIGHKTSELAVKGASAVVDKQYKGKCGPNGENIYINSQSQYYYVDKKGHKVYVKESELKDKKM
jgi:YbbR domain-containing protein